MAVIIVLATVLLLASVALAVTGTVARSGARPKDARRRTRRGRADAVALAPRGPRQRPTWLPGPTSTGPRG